MIQAASQIAEQDGRTTLSGEAYVPSGGSDAAIAFARALGYRQAHAEQHLVRDLPVAAADLDRLRCLSPAVDEWDVVTWVGRCPGKLIDGYARMRTQMLSDVPSGDLDSEAIEMTPERVRSGEERVAKSYASLVAAAVLQDGVMDGYSMMFLPHEGSEALQDDTLVMPEHRGGRLGTRLKLATLEILRVAHPERTTIHTWTAPDNVGMQRTNTDFGFREVEMMYEMQRLVR